MGTAGQRIPRRGRQRAVTDARRSVTPGAPASAPTIPPSPRRSEMELQMLRSKLEDGALAAYIKSRAASERGQGTVEYVGLILLVSLLMVGMVAGMRGCRGARGSELAEVIVGKIRAAVDKISFK